jgi:hypothetical protein
MGIFTMSMLNIRLYNLNLLFVADFNEIPLLELCLLCDNLLCDALGRAPSAKLTLAFRNNRSVPYWRKLGQTEVAEVSNIIRLSLEIWVSH